MTLVYRVAEMDSGIGSKMFAITQCPFRIVKYHNMTYYANYTGLHGIEEVWGGGIDYPTTDSWQPKL